MKNDMTQYLIERQRYLKKRDPRTYHHRSKNDFLLNMERDRAERGVCFNPLLYLIDGIAETAEGLRIIAKYIDLHTQFLREKEHREILERMGINILSERKGEP